MKICCYFLWFYLYLKMKFIFWRNCNDYDKLLIGLINWNFVLWFFELDFNWCYYDYKLLFCNYFKIINLIYFNKMYFYFYIEN